MRVIFGSLDKCKGEKEKGTEGILGVKWGENPTKHKQGKEPTWGKPDRVRNVTKKTQSLYTRVTWEVRKEGGIKRGEKKPKFPGVTSVKFHSAVGKNAEGGAKERENEDEGFGPPPTPRNYLLKTSGTKRGGKEDFIKKGGAKHRKARSEV